MNVNTLKAALTKFTGKKFVVIGFEEYNAVCKRAPAIIQDIMHVGDNAYIVTRCYGAGQEAYSVEYDSVSVHYFKQV